ncbi:MAG TPA: EAL domain-containing protein, partial [Micromonospora sp.]
VRAVGRWHLDSRTGRSPYVSVNVSASQLSAPGFVAGIRSALAAANVPPSLVMLEITESLLLADGDQVFAELTELRAAGLRVAIDDFGTGFSSLSYLQQIPVDVLKIDRSFVTNLATSPRQRALVEAILRMATTLGLEVIAEGVETVPARSLLVDLGCPTGQGYLFSRPLPDREIARWLRGRPPTPAPARRNAS